MNQEIMNAVLDLEKAYEVFMKYRPEYLQWHMSSEEWRALEKKMDDIEHVCWKAVTFADDREMYMIDKNIEDCIDIDFIEKYVIPKTEQEKDEFQEDPWPVNTDDFIRHQFYEEAENEHNR